jgi:hypothetical protein
VFKRGKLIGLEISAVSKLSSASDKNRGGAPVMPASRHHDPRQNLLRKNNDRRKGAGEFGPIQCGEGLSSAPVKDIK